MRARLAKAILMLAGRTLGARNAAWGQAMQAELDAAIEDGRPLLFALGCLLAAWRELPRFSDGRLVIVSHTLAIGLIVPLAAVWLWLGLLGFPYLGFGHVGFCGFVAGRSEQIPLLLVGEWALAPALTLVILLQSAGQLLLAWFLLERNWRRVSAVGRFNAAAMTTLLIVTAMIAVTGIGILVAIAVLITETLAILALAWWHEHLPQLSPVRSAA
jgi:hypothetical protein